MILKFRYGSPLKVVAHIGDDIGCRYDQQRWRLSECGRPLGLRFDSRGNLFVLDAYHGIKRIDIRTGYVELVCNVKSELERLDGNGKESIFIDDFVIDEVENDINRTDKSINHTFYISDASSKWPLEFVNHVVLDSDKSGRILKCSSSASGEGVVQVIDSGLAFPNGLELTPLKDAFLVNELNERRILKYFIKGSRKGRKEVLSVNLPGFPDNIKLSSRTLSTSAKSDKVASKHSASVDKTASKDERDNEAYWVALYEGFDSNHVNPLYKLVSYAPYLVQGAASAAHNLGLLIHKAGTRFHYPSLMQLGYEIKSLIIHQKIWKSYGLVIKLNSKGEIIKSLHSPAGVINHLSEVYQVKEDGKNVLYLGSYFNNYIGRLVVD